MVIKAWGPLVGLFMLAGAGVIGLTVDHPEPYNRSQPTVAENRNGPVGKSWAVVGAEHHDEKGNQKSEWYDYFKPTDWLLVIFNGFLVLYTRRLFQATHGLFSETSGLRQAAAEQRTDMLRSIAAAEKSAKVAEDALTVLEKPYVFIDRKIKLIKSIGEIKDFKTQNADFVCHIAVEYFIINHGRTPAIIKNLTTTMLIVDNIPEHRTITGTPEIPPAIGMAHGIPDGPLMCLSNEAATVVICDDILRGDKFLFFYGQITYRDVFSYEYLTGFGWRYFAKANVWNPAGGDEYNFHMNVSPEPMKKTPFRF